MHLRRGPIETLNISIASFYDHLLASLKDPAFRDGHWQLLDTRPAWEWNESNQAFVAFAWNGPGELRHLVAVNYASHQSQCYLILPWNDLAGRTWRFQDRLGLAVYDRNGDDLSNLGLYLDLPAWGYHVFNLEPV
jgi:hypothetical protein